MPDHSVLLLSGDGILLLARIARAWLGPMLVEAHVDLLEGLAALGAGVGGEGPLVARGHRCVGRLRGGA